MADGQDPECALTNKNLVDISHNIGNGWESLAVYLNIQQTQIDHIKAEYREMQQQIYNVLQKWKNTEGCNATLTSLLDKMINVSEVTIDWKALQDIFGSVVDNVFHKESDNRQQTGSHVPINIFQSGHIPGPSANVSQELLAVLQRDLIHYYQQLYHSLQISPLIGKVKHVSSFFDLYVKPILTIQNYQGEQGQSRTVRTLHDIFVRNSEHCKKIYISSPTGCGKTSFLKYLTLTWCQAHLPVKSGNQGHIAVDVNEMRQFKLLFFINLLDSHESECDVDTMIQQLLCRLTNSDKYAQPGFLQELLNDVTCIILLDGLDEWNHPQEKQCGWSDKQIPHSRARPLCTTLTTSRPWKLNVVSLKHEDIDQKLELNGLEGDLLETLVTRMNKLHDKDMKASDFTQELRDRKLTDLIKIPVIAVQLLTTWFEKKIKNEPLGESQCKIYSNMIEFLLKRYCKKRGIVSVIDDCGKDRQTPKCLQNNMFCNAHMELLLKLATLAYNTLLFTDNEESSLVFDRKVAKKYLKTDKEIDMSLAVGILTQENVLGNMPIRQSHISFIHKTFQEYLAALYIALSPKMMTNIEKRVKRICCSIEKCLEMSQIFMFLSGLCPEAMVKLHEHLRQTVSEDSRTQRYRVSSCGMEAWWGPGGKMLQRVQDTMEECLGECWLNGHEHITRFPVGDFFIGSPRWWSPSPWSAGLKSLAVHNPVCTLCLVGKDYSLEEIGDILNSVTVFNSIQKLWLWQISETFVVQLVSQHKHSVSVSPKTWRHLECVTLWQVYNISGDILCSLVDSILQLPKSVQVRLWWTSIRRGSRDGIAYIRHHRRLTVDKDVDVDVVKLLQFHTNKV